MLHVGIRLNNSINKNSYNLINVISFSVLQMEFLLSIAKINVFSFTKICSRRNMKNKIREK